MVIKIHKELLLVLIETFNHEDINGTLENWFKTLKINVLQNMNCYKIQAKEWIHALIFFL